MPPRHSLTTQYCPVCGGPANSSAHLSSVMRDRVSLRIIDAAIMRLCATECFSLEHGELSTDDTPAAAEMLLFSITKCASAQEGSDVYVAVASNEKQDFIADTFSWAGAVRLDGSRGCAGAGRKCCARGPLTHLYSCPGSLGMNNFSPN